MYNLLNKCLPLDEDNEVVKKKIKQNNPAYAVIKSTGDNVSGIA